MTFPRNPKYPNLQMYPKGYSGNRGGKPKMDPALRKSVQDMTPELFKRLRELSLAADSDSASIQAIKLLLLYAWGSPENRPEDNDEAEKAPELTIEELRALARQRISSEQPADDVPALVDNSKH